MSSGSCLAELEAVGLQQLTEPLSVITRDGQTARDMISTLLTIIFSLSIIPDPANSEKKQIYLAGTFPILGSEGWQGGQVRWRLVT